MKHPADAAYKIIEAVMSSGSKKDGRNESWRQKSKSFHRLKAIRHLINAQMIENGDIPDDSEPHEQNALTRIAMVLTNGR